MYTPGMHTPRGPAPGGQGGPGNMGQRYPSMQSVQSLLSQGYLPPGHGFVPKPIKPDKPYGPTFITVMNRTWRGPGKKYLQYALVTFSIAILFLCATGLYWGHRNVSRMIVLRTEYFGCMFTVIFICLVGLMFHFIYRARQESNRWRSYVRFRSEGLFRVAAYNDEYSPEDKTPLASGTYGKRALKEIPKPGRKRRPRKGQSRGGSGMNTPGGGAFQPHAPSLPVLQEQDDPPTPNYPPPPSVQAAAPSSKKRYEWPGQGGAYAHAPHLAPPPSSGQRTPRHQFPQLRQQYPPPPPPPQGGFQAPMDPRLDPRRYGGEQRYPIGGAMAGESST